MNELEELYGQTKYFDKSKQIMAVIKEFRKKSLGVTVYQENDIYWVRPTGEKIKVEKLELPEIRQILWEYGIVYVK